MVGCGLRVSGVMVPAQGLCDSSLHLVFLSLGSKRERNASSEISPKKVKWSSVVTCPSSHLPSDGDSSGSEDILRPCERPKGENWGQTGLTLDGERAGHLTVWGSVPVLRHHLPLPGSLSQHPHLPPGLQSICMARADRPRPCLLPPTVHPLPSPTD